MGYIPLCYDTVNGVIKIYNIHFVSHRNKNKYMLMSMNGKLVMVSYILYCVINEHQALFELNIPKCLLPSHSV